MATSFLLVWSTELIRWTEATVLQPSASEEVKFLDSSYWFRPAAPASTVAVIWPAARAWPCTFYWYQRVCSAQVLRGQDRHCSCYYCRCWWANFHCCSIRLWTPCVHVCDADGCDWDDPCTGWQTVFIWSTSDTAAKDQREPTRAIPLSTVRRHDTIQDAILTCARKQK